MNFQLSLWFGLKLVVVAIPQCEQTLKIHSQQPSELTLRQLYNDASEPVLIENNGVT